MAAALSQARHPLRLSWGSRQMKWKPSQMTHRKIWTSCLGPPAAAGYGSTTRGVLNDILLGWFFVDFLFFFLTQLSLKGLLFLDRFGTFYLRPIKFKPLAGEPFDNSAWLRLWRSGSNLLVLLHPFGLCISYIKNLNWLFTGLQQRAFNPHPHWCGVQRVVGGFPDISGDLQ